MYDDKNISKLYRYEALLQAIDFFTQKFSVSQLASYAFDFTNEILTLNSSALFLKEGEYFKLTRVRSYNVTEYTIENSEKLQRIATFYGSVMSSNFDSYFNSKDTDFFGAKLIIPLIIQDLLYGFIISDGKAVESIDEDDMLISKALMQLINNSLENSKNFADLQEKNKQLDQKIFNLFSINQSSRMLLSELELNKLYTLAIDIFSELTSSKITAFGLFDEIRDKIVIKGYKDVFSPIKIMDEFELNTNSYNGYKLVFNYKNDIEQLKQIFVNYADFEKLEAEYIILIVKNKILGFVTISKPINDRQYDESLFELIESLAASTYISFTNAIFFQEVSRQKSIIEQKLNTLTKLNALVKNIHSCTDLEELYDLTIRTLHYAFGIKKAFIAIKDKNQYTIKKSVGIAYSDNILELNEEWELLDSSETFSSYTKDACCEYFSDNSFGTAEECNCLVISPITSDAADLDSSSQLMGYLVVLQTSESLREEEVLLIETIANSIAPIMSNMKSVEQMKANYLLNQQAAFENAVKKKLENKANFHIDFYIYYKQLPQKPFVEVDLSSYKQFEAYYFANYLFILSEVALDASAFDGSIFPNRLEEIMEIIKGI